MTTPQFTLRKYIPYPSFPVLKYVFKSPIVLWRLGLGRLAGQHLMLMTIVGRKSGLLRHTVVEYHSYKDRKYVIAAWPKADWYHNLLENPCLTIQTADGSEEVMARRLTTDEELSEAYEVVEHTPLLQKFWQKLGYKLDRSEFLAHKDRFYMFTFDPVYEPTPEPLPATLSWVWGVGLVSGLLGGLVGGLLHLRKRSQSAS